MMARLTIMAALLLFTTWRQSQAALIGSYRGSRRVCPRILNSRNSRPLSVTTSNVDTTESSQSWLVVGDGDLSYCSTIAQDLAGSNIKLLATVLENEDVHNKVYQRSIENTRTICKFGTVQFGVDATKLEDLYQDKRFDCIEFNFPHWRGKTNAKYNRELVDNFLKSASKVLKRDGKIFIAFCDGQGGMPSESLEKWRQSWMPAMYAASYGLMLRKIDPYDPQYFLSSHRGVDRPFNVGKHPQKYIFSFPNGKSVSQDLQLSCRHELRIVLDPMKLAASQVSFDDIVKGNAVSSFAQDFIPEGIRFEIPAKELFTIHNDDNQSFPLAVFLFNYSGESLPLTRQEADTIRANIEAAIVNRWGLEIAKPGRLVSRPYPRHLLPLLIKDYDTS